VSQRIEPTETEVKLRCESVEQFKALLEGSGAIIKLKRNRHFEDNVLLDSRSDPLSAHLSVLRVRKTDDVATITLKEMPPADAPPSQFKKRIELETSVGDGDMMLEIFARLGFHKWFRYQKYRTIYEALLPSGASADLMVDETPIGTFAEFEGTEDEVREALETIGAGRDQQILLSYLALQAERCASEGRPLSDLVF